MLHKSLVRRLDLITLQLFVAVFEEGTLTRAANREAIAVSAASKRLMELEQVLGVSLFVRRAKGMDLTAAGETLLHHARQMLFNVEKMGLELGEHSHGVRGYVRMLANLSAIIQFLPEDLRDFSESHPEVKTDLEERPSNGVVQGVLDGVADLGICSSDTDTKGLPSVTYRHDKLVVLMPKDHSLASRESLAFAETLDSDYVGLHAASSINMRTHAAAREAGKMLRLRIHVPGFDAMCRMVQANMGIGVLPQKAYELFGRALGLHAVPLTDDWSDRNLILVVRDEAQLSPVSRLLFDYLSVRV
ncbi:MULTISPECIES: LysR family transcriptional regulator [Pseudomonas fluorescens group]|uniref:LysR-family regulatory protein n=2 Tax=Pseudomonas fluorescens TaxID=294 RepID=C3KCV9_PSEFS|nr:MULTISPECIES: LysR family transcriptional regulator [Pseudomonas fluorescens group]KJZ51537.1 LysR family transcriptional regulator [Pseudomonas marginalis]KJZ60720.1 LysR family transcriptional regulator [Pseudomonas marginalis]MBZ6456964.1 LysR family transcriptional regulator [Pseudomonas fluorescens group sp.]MBZ6461259.1 LysR family transcriptional regulator [Pseudomonas fluorescens group sp.]MBZ6469891.1 LysR family transcriptional regulator [Pseudomonas fluorescens group sp.]